MFGSKRLREAYLCYKIYTSHWRLMRTKIIKQCLTAVSILCVGLIKSYAQAGPVFRQYINYQIEVQLDDINHRLLGNIKWTYTNQSPDTLFEMYIHLWPNAYRDDETAFAKQQLAQLRTDFHFTSTADRGGIDSLAFRVDGTPVELKAFQGQADVVVISLDNRPLPPGKTMTVETPFRVKIPAAISRLGHEGQAYQISQWYPKPAVYDKDGWHPMPYLDMGEFYSDFASYDVYITLPDNYQVGATGMLQNQDELRRLRELSLQTRQYLDTLRHPARGRVEEPFPPSAPGWKILHYRADNVHDFAWFADKRYKHLQDTLRLPSGRVITAAVFFTKTEENLWKDALSYVKRSTRFYAEKVGEYPYMQVTAVQGALLAGGGMEYPMVTIIAEAGNAAALDRVIAHEVGHNWFYGVLASNERDFAWMDEGLNSYYERRYMQAYYPDSYAEPLPNLLTGGDDVSQEMALWEVVNCRHIDQAASTHSGAFRPVNYYLGAYAKPALALAQWEGYRGAQRVDSAMQQYYRQWQFKHPQPDDLKAVLEKASGDELTWLFDGFLYSRGRQDYKIERMQIVGDTVELVIRNTATVNGPFPISLYAADRPVHEGWQAGFQGSRTIRIPLPEEVDRAMLDAHRQTLDADRQNNSSRAAGLLKKWEPLQLRLLAGYNRHDRSSIYITPLPGWNTHDGLLLGGLLHGGLLPGKNTAWYAAPLYGVRSGAINGTAGARHRWYPETGKIAAWQLSGNISSFHTTSWGIAADTSLRAIRLTGRLQAELFTEPGSGLSRQLALQYWHIQREVPVFSTEGESLGLGYAQPGFIGELSYQQQQRSALKPWQLTAAAEYHTFVHDRRDQSYLKLSLDASGQWQYRQKQWLSWRFFGGYFPYNSLKGKAIFNQTALTISETGYYDYRMDQYFMDRQASNGLAAQLTGSGQGGFRLPLLPSYLGRSQSFLVAANMTTDFPFLPSALPLRIWGDIAYFGREVGIDNTAGPVGAAGIALEDRTGKFGLYWPLLVTEQLRGVVPGGGRFPVRVNIRLALHQLTPWQILDDVLARF